MTACAIHHELRYVRNVIQNEIAVCADETRNIYVLVINAQIVTFPERRSITSITGLSRRSSVPALKLKPKNADPLISLLHNHLQPPRDLQFVAREDRGVRIGSCRSWILAWYDSARKSLGRQEPPNAKPGIRYAEEIFSFLSWQKIFITSCASISNALHIFPISFANPIFSACQLLSTYLIISAV